MLKFVTNEMLFKRKDYLGVELNCFEMFDALKQFRIMDLFLQVMDRGT